MSLNSAIFIAGLAGVAAFNLRARRLFRAQDSIIQKYRLFKVRDDLIHLLATQQVSADDPVFQTLYEMVNFLARRIDVLNLRNLLGAMREAEEKGVSPNDQKLGEALARKNLEVRAVASEFFSVMQEILVENSATLRLMTKYPRAFKIVKASTDLVGKLPNTAVQTDPWKAYHFYQQYQHAQRHLPMMV